MNYWLTRVRVLAAAGIVSTPLALLAPSPAAAERPTEAGQVFFWLLGLHLAPEHARLEKVDVNSATVDELRAVPGIERRQAVQIVAQRPYSKLADLVRAGLSPHFIERLAAFLTVDHDWPGALPGSPVPPPPR
jgi:DNA uptake protein ComE-like DNA-binding protein